MATARVPQISVQQPDGSYALTPVPSLPLSRISDATDLGRNLVASSTPSQARSLLDVPSNEDLTNAEMTPGPQGPPGPTGATGAAGPMPTVTPVASVNDIPAGAAVGSLWLPTTV